MIKWAKRMRGDPIIHEFHSKMEMIARGVRCSDVFDLLCELLSYCDLLCKLTLQADRILDEKLLKEQWFLEAQKSFMKPSSPKEIAFYTLNGFTIKTAEASLSGPFHPMTESACTRKRSVIHIKNLNGGFSSKGSTQLALGGRQMRCWTRRSCESSCCVFR